MTSRRALLRRGAAAVALGALGLGGQLGRAQTGARRRLLVLFANGGWDVTWALAPVFDLGVWMPEQSVLAEQGGHRWVSSAARPAVDDFFVRHGAQTAVLHGMEIRSIAHERCRRLLLTGTSSVASDDFGTRIAAQGTEPLPYVVFSGPNYAAERPDVVVRVGTGGQLRGLVDGSAARHADPALAVPDADLEALEDAFVRQRTADALARASEGRDARVLGDMASVLRNVDALADVQDVFGRAGRDARSQALAALDLFARGASRCAIVADDGYAGLTWDHHAELSRQGPSWNGLFSTLSTIMDALATRTDDTGIPLAETVTVAVCSELGRDPRLNASGGKDHWTTTSLLLCGAGVRGGQSLGAYGEGMAATPMRLEDGALDTEGTSGGVLVTPAHLGATLLALAGEDHEVMGVPPLAAMLADA